jgi:hypothetical protein
MNPISNAAQAISAAFVRFERGAQELQAGVQGDPQAEPASGIAQMMTATAQLKAGVATARIADQMLEELIKIGQDPER